MSTEADDIMAKCLSDIVNEVAKSTGRSPEQVQAVFDIARMASTLEKAEKAGLLAPAPRMVQ